FGGSIYRLGRADWAPVDNGATKATQTVLARDGRPCATFMFKDSIRPGALTAVARLKHQGFRLEILSGDREPVVGATASELGIEGYAADLLPNAKVDHIKALAHCGRMTLMVGDGLNDAPALAAAHASMAPASAADIGRAAADFVFLHENLAAVPI